MQLQINPVPRSQRKTPPQSMSGVVFGSQFTDHMFSMEWDEEKGWHSAKIDAYRLLQLEPSSLVLHYGQQAFEGLKAYPIAHNQHTLFRPQNNFERMNQTARRMCLPEIDSSFVLHALQELLLLDIGWIPQEEGTSLYIRPTIIATEPALGLRVARQCLFFIIMCPVGPYYPEGFNPVKIIVSDQYCRATPGGVGHAKTAGNYAASIYAEREAAQSGYTQVLWLDAIERKYVEEVGSMNIFFVINDEIITPQLTGTILPGITRKSVIELAQHWGMKITERRISIDEIIDSIQNGSLTEIFGSGTAAVISPVGEIRYKNQSYAIQDQKTGVIAQKFFDSITGIQYGHQEDPFGWRFPIN